MADYRMQDIRNIAIVGHAGSGKTTLVESLLKQTGTIEKGDTVCDYHPQEKLLGHSLDSAIVSLSVEQHHINLIDTPGYPDFLGRSISALAAVETAALVINAQNGIEPVSQRMMEIIRQRKLCSLIIINQIDSHEFNPSRLLEEIQQQFGRECLPINLPAKGGTEVIDCFFLPEGGETDISSVSSAHSNIIDQVVEVDEKLMEIYLEQGEELEPKQLHDPFEKALRDRHLIPVCFTSAQSGAGIPQLLEIFSRLMPNPQEGNSPPFMKGEGDDMSPVKVSPTPDGHALGHVFKILNDPFRGKLGIFRLHQGCVTPDTQLFVGDARKAFKVSHLYRIEGDRLTEMTQAVPGDICALARVEELYIDAVIHDSHDEDHHHLRALEYPVPLYGLAIQPTKRGDEQKLSDTLQKLESEDPCLVVEHNVSQNETVLRGLGEMHLKIVLEQLKEQYNLEVETHPPSISYRETITVPAEGHYRHKKQTGGAGQFGEVFLRITPLPRGSGFQFINKIVGGAIPASFIPATEKGVRQAMQEGSVAGFQLQDIEVTLYDGKFHSVDSKEIAFVTAGRKALHDAVEKARPVILEPIVKISLSAPHAAMGDLTGDLSSRRGKINGTEADDSGRLTIRGEVPLAELEGYESRLKSMTGGEGEYMIEFDHYEPVPGKLQRQLIEQHRDK